MADTYAVRLRLEAFATTSGAPVRILDCPTRWSNLPGVGLLAIELEFLALQERLVALGVHREATRTDHPEHLRLLRDLAAGLPLPAILDAASRKDGFPLAEAEAETSTAVDGGGIAGRSEA